MAGPILIVDDDAAVLDTLRTALESEGYKVVTARNGVAALVLMRSETRPALVLLDLVMDTMSGAELLEQKTGDASIAEIPVIAMSGYFASPYVTDVSWVLSKPIDLDQLLSHVRAALRG